MTYAFTKLQIQTVDVQRTTFLSEPNGRYLYEGKKYRYPNNQTKQRSNLKRQDYNMK